MIAAMLLAAAAPGVVEATFPVDTAGTIAAKLAVSCADNGWAVASQTDNQVVCEGKADPLSSLGEMAKGRYAKDSRGTIRFTLLPGAERIRVQAYAFSEFTNAFGVVRRVPFEITNIPGRLMTGAGGTIGAPPP